MHFRGIWRDHSWSVGKDPKTPPPASEGSSSDWAPTLRPWHLQGCRGIFGNIIDSKISTFKKGCHEYVSRRVTQPFNLIFLLNHLSRQMIGFFFTIESVCDLFLGCHPQRFYEQGSWNLTLTFHCLEAWCQDNVWWCELSAIILLLGIIPFFTLSLNSKKKISRDRPKLSSTPSLSHHFVWKNGYKMWTIFSSSLSSLPFFSKRYLDREQPPVASDEASIRGHDLNKTMWETGMFSSILPTETHSNRRHFRWRSSGQESQKMSPFSKVSGQECLFVGGDFCL